ncbi:MAG TPA: GlsB/YeaQ/YmgE family stress response membrane protein [Hyphomicrobiales bacterium]|nr:GlsB/YeaQ/YmgE family stress response membrane protein [Rhodobiaceae bacterium]HXK54274.1 GlsB/YeaQ/YmgE family stress response membrane protein [Hyphomicrobiales bacterium]
MGFGGLIGLIVIGLIAGYIAEKVTKSDHGLLTNLVVGLIGSFGGGFLANTLGLRIAPGFWSTLIVATVGAIIFLYLWKMLRGRR